MTLTLWLYWRDASGCLVNMGKISKHDALLPASFIAFEFLGNVYYPEKERS